MLALSNSVSQTLRILTCIVLVMTTVTSCGKEDEKKKEPETDAAFAGLWNDVFANRCGTCHGVTSNTDTLGGPDMRTQDAFHAGMVNKKGSDYPNWDTFQTNRVDCLAIPFITPGNPNQSLLVAIFDSTVKPCTIKSHTEPPQSISMSAAQLASLKSWITSGAPR
jgi:hypothetical protein